MNNDRAIPLDVLAMWQAWFDPQAICIGANA
jgi:hypothetical protein